MSTEWRLRYENNTADEKTGTLTADFVSVTVDDAQKETVKVLHTYSRRCMIDAGADASAFVQEARASLADRNAKKGRADARLEKIAQALNA